MPAAWADAKAGSGVAIRISRTFRTTDGALANSRSFLYAVALTSTTRIHTMTPVPSSPAATPLVGHVDYTVVTPYERQSAPHLPSCLPRSCSTAAATLRITSAIDAACRTASIQRVWHLFSCNLMLTHHSLCRAGVNAT